MDPWGVRNKIEEEFEKIKGLPVHKLVVDHNSACSIGQPLLQLCQQFLQTCGRIGLFSGVKVDIDLQITES